MAMTSQAVVAGAAHTPLPFGLFSVLPLREESADRWESGVTFEGIGCEPGPLKGVGDINCESPEETVGFPKNTDEGGVTVSEAGTFLVYETYKCSPAGHPIGFAEEMAEQRLLIREEMRVEQALASGELGQSPSLAESEPLGNLGSLSETVATLEALAARTFVGQGVFHMSRSTALLALEQGIIETSGNRLRTLLHTPVVAGTGYDFEGVIVTPPMFGYRSEVFTASNREGDLLDHGRNDLTGIAERQYLIGWDDCGAWSAEFTMTGESGMTGESAYEVAVRNGFEGTEEEWLASLVGPRGKTGQRGPAGPQGPAGEPGAIQSIVAGDGIVVDDSDPAAPVISAPAE